MEKIPTAEEFLKRDKSGIFNEVDMAQALIEFAKLHVEAALKLITTEATVETINKYSPEEQHIVNQDSILNAYPLENIK
jgi:hypothetical protein